MEHACKTVITNQPFFKSLTLEISELILNMKDTLKFIGASGLAAPQVMVSKSVIVYRVKKNRIPLGSKFSPKPWTYMINPEITPITKKKKMYF